MSKKDIQEYRELHIGCEAQCGRRADHIHHMRSVGAGGYDSPDNLLALCVFDHTAVHTLGWRTFGSRHPHLMEKLEAAHDRSRF